MLKVFLIGCTISGFIFFCIGVYHTSKWAYSFLLFWINFEYRYFLKLIELYRNVFPNDSFFKIIPKCFRNAKLAKIDQSRADFYNRLFSEWLPKKTTTKPVSRGDYHDTH
jgi:hypothetical protein